MHDDLPPQFQPTDRPPLLEQELPLIIEPPPPFEADPPLPMPPPAAEPTSEPFLRRS